MNPNKTIKAFDEWLVQHDLEFEAVVIGGSALSLLGVIERHTQDVDVLEPDLPAEIAESARAFAEHFRDEDGELDDDWLNSGPRSLAKELPVGWRERVRPLFAGEALRLSTLGRSDLLHTKLFALCDRGLDLQDCIALRPSPEELAQCRPWVSARDAHEGWPAHVAEVFTDLARRLGHGL